MSNSTNLKQLSGGSVIASGDITSDFSYALLDEKFIKLITSGEATLTLTNNGLSYLEEVIQVIEGVITFTIPVLKPAVYQVSVTYNGAIYPSDGGVSIIVERNPSDGVLQEIGPLTLADYLTNYALKTEIPDTSLLALKSDIPDVSGLALKTEIPSTEGLATETYVNEKINGISAPDLTGLATEIYVQDQIATIQIQEPIDTSLFLTKPLSEPTLSTDPTTKNYVDNAVANVSGGSSEEWTILRQGTTARVDLWLKDYLVYNKYKKVKLLYSFNTGPSSSSNYWNYSGSATSFNAHFNFKWGGQSVIYPIYNQSSEVSLKPIPYPEDRPVTYKAGNALFEIDFQKVNTIYNLNIQSIYNACKLDIKVNLDPYAISLDAISGAPLYNYTPNYNTFFTLDEKSNSLYFLIDNVIGANAADTKVFWTILGSNS